MNNLPNFSSFGYQVLATLNHNVHGGRITYLAEEISRKKKVVIKQFQFARDNNDWAGYKEIEREIKVLKKLNHTGIPQYLAQFDSGEGLCLVQEYIKALPLSQCENLTVEEIKDIATQILKILVYLQEQNPPVFHRDIKPENLLINNKNQVYLIDFGLAHTGSNTLAMSTMFGGTMGFMSPEQIYNRKLNKSSDLYSLGVTLISLLTGTSSGEVGNLISINTNQIKVRSKLPHLNIKFLNWLEKMTDNNSLSRYQDAQIALNKLNNLANLEETLPTYLSTNEGIKAGFSYIFYLAAGGIFTISLLAINLLNFYNLLIVFLISIILMAAGIFIRKFA